MGTLKKSNLLQYPHNIRKYAKKIRRTCHHSGTYWKCETIIYLFIVFKNIWNSINSNYFEYLLQ